MPYGEEARTDEEGDEEEEEECVESGRMRGFADIDNGSSDKQLTINMQWLKNGDIRASVSRLCGGIIVVLFSDFVLIMVDASSNYTYREVDLCIHLYTTLSAGKERGNEITK